MKHVLKKRQVKGLLRNYYAAERVAAPASLERIAASLAGSCSQETHPKRLSYFSFLSKQAKLISGWVWAGECLLLSLMYVVASSIEAAGPVLFCLGAFSLLTAIIGVPDLIKGRAHNMCELESSCAFGLAPILISRLLVLGAGQVLLITCMCLATSAFKTNLVFELLLTASLPYFSSLAGSLAFLRKRNVSQIPFAICVYNVGLAGALFLLAQFGGRLLFQGAALGVWMTVCLLAAFWCIRETHALIKLARFGIDGFESVQQT